MGQKRMRNSLIVIGLLMVSLSACYNDNEEMLYGVIECETLEVSFANDIMPIINNSCATSGCHVVGGIGDGLFENYTQVLAKVDNGSFEDRVVVRKDMPPSTPLSDCQLQYIEQWLAEGAPNN